MLSRWDPFREMLSMRRTMDRLIEGTMDEDNTNLPEWGLALDVVEDEDAYLVKASVPGIKPDDLEITFNKGMLTIRGEVKDENENTQGQYHLRERRYGSFARTISLPSTVDADDIEAQYQNGVLTLKMPKSEELKPRRIPIQGKDGQKVIEAKNK
jgi:HSP20 family protein